MNPLLVCSRPVCSSYSIHMFYIHLVSVATFKKPYQLGHSLKLSTHYLSIDFVWSCCSYFIFYVDQNLATFRRTGRRFQVPEIPTVTVIPSGKFIKPTCYILYMTVQRWSNFRWRETLTNFHDNPQIGSEVITGKHTHGHADNMTPHTYLQPCTSRNVSQNTCSDIKYEKVQMGGNHLNIAFQKVYKSTLVGNNEQCFVW
jgi:hypothetical protein